MATAQQILEDVDLRYRNTFTVKQKLVWFNEEQRELFDVLELDSPPYAFATVAGERYYPFPDDFDTSKIKTVTYQTNSSNPTWTEIDFYRNDNKQVPSSGPWWTIVSDVFYLHDDTEDGRIVYIYTDSDPQEVTEANISSPPDTPTKYQEILKLGILKRIAMARKDALMLNNYVGDYEQKIADVTWLRKLKEPEWIQPIDMLPRI